MSNARLVYDGDWVYTDKEKRINKLTQDVEEKIDNIPGVVDNLNSTSTTDALSANMGKALQDQIDAMTWLNKYLSSWDCTTGLPVTDPMNTPYTYSTWDYYIVAVVAPEGTLNYRPHWSVYTPWVASQSVEMDEVHINDFYIYDWSQWILQVNKVKEIIIDDGLSPTSKNAVENRAVYLALTTKQDNILDLGTIRSGAALWATSIQPWDNITELTNNAGYQTAGEVASAINSAISWIAPDVNTKTFYLTSCWDTAADIAQAQPVLDWVLGWKNAIIQYSNKEYMMTYNNAGSGTAVFNVTHLTVRNTNQTHLIEWWQITIYYTGTTVNRSNYVNISYGKFLSTDSDYGSIYSPQYDWSPTTKKYVDDNISSAVEGSKYVWPNAPSNPTEWMLWYDTTNDQLKVYDWTQWNVTWKEYVAWNGISINWTTISNTWVLSSNSTYNNIIYLSQADYDALQNKDANTLYSTPDNSDVSIVNNTAYWAAWIWDIYHAPSNSVLYTKISSVDNNISTIQWNISTMQWDISALQTAVSWWISDAAFSSAWDWDTTHAPSKNAIYDVLWDVETLLANL